MSEETEESLQIIDTYPDFRSCWKDTGELPVKYKLEKWLNEYMEGYSALLEKQVEDYESKGFDWRKESKEKVFPDLEERLPRMEEARENLLELVPEIHDRARKFFELDPEISVVIYVGIGCGAGWSTEFKGKSALLFGLENIAECDWTDHRSLEGLTAHELGHLFHERIREASDLSLNEGPLWRIYEEGVAKWSEFKLLDRESWYEARGLNEAGWLNWCREHRGWLAEEFLQRVEKEKSVDQFFGSWYDLRGWKQTGYFLGYEAVTGLISNCNLKEQDILKISDPSEQIKRSLKKIAKRRGKI